jgi:hypothetical protein
MVIAPPTSNYLEDVLPSQPAQACAEKYARSDAATPAIAALAATARFGRWTKQGRIPIPAEFFHQQFDHVTWW